MAIVVSCKNCGKSFKAKDELAGKAVRCPGCQQPLKIPGGPGVAAVGAGKPAGGGAPAAAQSSVDAAIAKVEAARKKREAEAAQAESQKSDVAKLVEEFDLVAPKAKEKEQKKLAEGKAPGAPDAKLGEKAKTVTKLDKAADRVGMLKGTLVWKYVVAVIVLGGAGWASTVMIQKVMTTTKEHTTVTQVGEKEIEQLYKQAEEAADVGNWSKVRDNLEQIKLAASWRVNNVRYKNLKGRLEKATGG